MGVLLSRDSRRIHISTHPLKRERKVGSVAEEERLRRTRPTVCLNLEHIAEYSVHNLNDTLSSSVSSNDRHVATEELLIYAEKVFKGSVQKSQKSSFNIEAISIEEFPMFLNTVLRELRVNGRVLNPITREIVMDDLYVAMAAYYAFVSWKDIRVLLTSLSENISRFEQPFM